MLTAKDMQTKLQLELLAAVWKHDNERLTALLTEAEVMPAVLSLRTTIPVSDTKSNFLEVAFFRGNKAAIIKLVNFCRHDRVFITAACSWLPASVASALSKFQDSPRAEAEFLKLLEFYTAKTTIDSRLKKIEQEENLVNSFAASSMEAIIKTFFPKHYATFPPGAHALAIKINAEYFAKLWTTKQQIIRVLMGVYQEIITDFLAEQSAYKVDFLATFYYRLKKCAFEIGHLFKASTSFVKATRLGDETVSSMQARAAEMQELFATDLAFLSGILEPLYECLDPKFIAYMDNSEFVLLDRGEFKYNVAIKVGLQRYSTQLDDLVKQIYTSLTGSSFCDAVVLQELMGQTLALQMRISNFTMNRQALALQHNAKGIMFTSDDTKAAFDCLYDFTQEAFGILDGLLRISVRPYAEPITIPISSVAAAPAVFVRETAQSTTDLESTTAVLAATYISTVVAVPQLTMAAQPTAISTAETPQPAVSVASQPSVAASVESQPPVAVRWPSALAAREEKLPEAVQSAPAAVLQPRGKESLPTAAANEPLSDEEFNCLRRMQLAEYKESINGYRAAKNKANISRRRLACSGILEAIQPKTNAANFEAALQQYIDSHPVEQKLVEQTDTFIATNAPVLHSELSPLLRGLGFTEKKTTDGFCFMYGRFSASYHVAHEKFKGSFIVDPKSAQVIRKALRDNNVMQHLLKKSFTGPR